MPFHWNPEYNERVWGTTLPKTAAGTQHTMLSAAPTDLIRTRIVGETSDEAFSAESVRKVVSSHHHGEPFGNLKPSFLPNLLASLPALDGARPEQVQRMVDAMESCRMPPREVIIREGDQNAFYHVIAAGRVLIITGDGSMAKTETLLHEGQGFGEEALNIGAPATYTAIAQGAVQIWRLHRLAFKVLQAHYGSRLRSALAAMLSRGLVPAPKTTGDAMRQVVRAAQQNQRQLDGEFADVPSALLQLEVVEKLGEGQFGEVSLVVHKPTRTAYALKVQTYRKEKRANIDREISAMRDGASPFLMRFFGEHEFAPGRSKMLLEYLNGGDLSAVMRTPLGLWAPGGPQGFPTETARFYFACCVAAVDVLHAATWMHRDIKLENMVIDSKGYAKLIDCGLSKPVKEGEHTFTMCGTPAYYAPEVVKQTGYNHAAELWTLGVLLHELLSGSLPFDPLPDPSKKVSDRLNDLFNLIVKTAPSYADKHGRTDVFTPAAKEILSQLLRKDAQQRVGIREIRGCRLFAGFAWDAFHARKMPPPFLPKPKENVP